MDRFDDLTSVEDVINKADEMLEGANMHELSASQCWDCVEKYIPKEKRLKAAKELARWFNSLC